MGTLTPRVLRLIGGSAAVVAFAAVALFLILRGGKEEPSGRAPLTGPIEDGFVHRALSPNETPDAEHGIVFVDVASGEGEFWTVPGAANVEYLVDANHRWLVMSGFVAASGGANQGQGGFVRVTLIADRETNKSYRLNSRVVPEQAKDERGWALITRLGQTPGLVGPTPEGLLVVQSQTQAASFAVVDLANDPTGVEHEFSLPVAASSSLRINSVVDSGVISSPSPAWTRHLAAKRRTSWSTSRQDK